MLDDPEVMWSFQERPDPRVTPNNDILSQNYTELKLKDMLGSSILMPLEIKQNCVLYPLKFTK